MWICTCVRHNQPSLQISVVSFQQKINSFFQVHCPICIQSFSMYTSEIGDSTSTKSESVPVPLSVSSMEKKRKVRTGSTQFSYSEKHLPVAQETWKKNEVGTPCTSEQAVGTPATSKFVFIFKSLCLWMCWLVIPAVYCLTTSMASTGSGNFTVGGNFLLFFWAWDYSWITLWWLRPLCWSPDHYSAGGTFIMLRQLVGYILGTIAIVNLHEFFLF